MAYVLEAYADILFYRRQVQSPVEHTSSNRVTRCGVPSACGRVNKILNSTAIVPGYHTVFSVAVKYLLPKYVNSTIKNRSSIGKILKIPFRTKVRWYFNIFSQNTKLDV